MLTVCGRLWLLVGKFRGDSFSNTPAFVVGARVGRKPVPVYDNFVRHLGQT